MKTGKKTLFQVQESLDNNYCVDEEGDIVVLKLGEKTWNKPLRLVDFYIFIFCRKGHSTCTIDNVHYEINAETLFFIGQYSFIDNIVASPDYEGLAICFSQSMVTRYFLRNKKMWSRLHFLQKNRVIRFSKDRLDLQLNFYNIFYWLLNETDQRPYYEHIIDGIFRCFFYCQLSTIPDVQEQVGARKENESLIARFVDMVKEDEARHRDLSFYADQLCVTTKYLSTMCKHSLGKTAHKIIEEETVTMVKYYLYSTDLSIKQIAAELNFCSLSFFGKFVRQHFDKSPSEIRAELQ